MLTDALQITGQLTLELFDQNGSLRERRVIKNLVVTAGKVVVAERLAKASPSHAAMTHMAVGSGTTAAAVGDTALETQITRVALSQALPVSNTVQFSASFPAAVGTGTWTEAGLFNASSGGDMLCRSVFSAITKAATDNLTITWTVTVG